MPSPFPPIADYGFLSDCHTGALVAPDGGVDWLCVPRFDSPSVFGSLLDREAGTFRFGPFGINVPTQRVYEAGTNVLVTTWKTPSGWVVVRDALTIGPTPRARHRSRRTPGPRPTTTPSTSSCGRPSASTVRSRWSWSASRSSTTGETPATWTLVDETGHTADATGAGVTIRLHTDMSHRHRGRTRPGPPHAPRRRQARSARLSWADGLAGPDDVDDATRPHRHHGGVLAGLAGPGPDPRPPLARSDPALGAGDQGADLHADGRDGRRAHHVTCPRRPAASATGTTGTRWMRDSTFTLQALHWLNLDWEADEFMQFVADLEVNEDGALQIMYGIDGRRDLTESTLTHLSGYAGARPVRVGNGAFDQRQNDVFGAALDSILLHTRRSQRLPRRLWPLVQAQAECASAVWRAARSGHLGGSRRAAALRVVQADVLGGTRPRRQAGRAPRRRRPGGEVAAPSPTRSAPTSRSSASAIAACSASTTRPTPWTPRRSWRPSSGSCPATTSGPATACWRSPTS